MVLRIFRRSADGRSGVFPVYSLPKIVCGLLGEILASATESCEFEAMGKIGGDCRMSIQDSGQLPPRIPDVPGQRRHTHVDGGQHVFTQGFPGWGGLCIGIMAS